ncbi:hypothetical protein KY285_003733 [Solanum tuberosum]|nr:hypothetical protein KY285_003733 [Solanum tuberosum]
MLKLWCLSPSKPAAVALYIYIVQFPGCNSDLHLNPVHAVVQLRPPKWNLKESELKKNVTTNNDEKSVEIEDVKEKRPVGPSKKQKKPPLIEKDIGEKMAMEEGSPVPFSMSPVDYLNAFCPGRPTDTDKLKILRTRLSQLPLEERVRTWLLEGPPIHRFDALKHLALDNSADEIIRVLQIHAQLVQGLRSEFLKAATPALKSLAVERPDLNDWKLKEHPDKKFENLYGDVVREKQATW